MSVQPENPAGATGVSVETSAIARQHLREFLAEQDVECPSCRYNLRGLSTDSCPECSQRLVLRLALAEPRLAGFVAGLIGLSMGLGVHAFLAVGTGIMLWVEGVSGGGPPETGVLVLSTFGLFHGALVWLWVQNRRRITRVSALARWSLAVTGCLLPVATFFAAIELTNG